MIQDNATVGDGVPMFNAEQTIGATLASIRWQTYQALDIVVVDDGSTDGSASNSVPEDRFLWQEIAGHVSGLLFYLRTRHG